MTKIKSAAAGHSARVIDLTKVKDRPAISR